ncbi:Scr1 family TA system antitoxin-like transcriptional regulator [Streptomyces sp. NPDC002262]|uniref:Scr1 family TA system antitoxin-like transcriptional regulator n=1 Tax=Streptomyces sp. NPDC002262 TaxID=3154414 RepID=UPI0033292A90
MSELDCDDEPDVNDEAPEDELLPFGPPCTNNLTRPWPPRVYDFMTGGGESYQADRAFGHGLDEAVPWMAASMQINKVHRTPAALTLAGAGIRQFIDLGCGYPSGMMQGNQYVPPHTYDVVRTVHEDVRVVYADADGFVYGHAKSWLAENRATRAIQADARDIVGLLRSVDDFLDLEQPIGVLLHEVLPWLDDADAENVLRSLHRYLPAGSAVSVTHSTGDFGPEGMARAVALYEAAGITYRPRTLDHVRDLLRPWSLLGPGIVPTGRWRDDQAKPLPPGLRAAWDFDPEDSHAYAAVTTPKVAGPRPAMYDVLNTEKPPVGYLLVGACLRAGREIRRITVKKAAAAGFTTPRAVRGGEAGIRRYLESSRDPSLGRLNLWDAPQVLDHLRRYSGRPWTQEMLVDHYPGNGSRANALMRTASHLRVFALDRIPDAFQTPGYATEFPLSAVPDDEPFPAPRAEKGADRRTWEIVLDEAVLRRTNGAPAMMAAQLTHLLDLADLPHITIHVLPLDAPLSLPVAHLVEHRLRTGRILWREDGFTYTGYDRGSRRGLMLDRAFGAAADPATSRSLIAQTRDRLSSRSFITSNP